MKHRELSYRERERISIYKARGKSHREISKLLGRDRRTIDREVKRNLWGRDYLASDAQILASQRKHIAAVRPWLKNETIRSYVVEKLKQRWSPLLISGRLNDQMPDMSISYESIYKYIYAKDWDLHQYLPRSHKYRRKRKRYHKRRSKIENRLFIGERAASINKRKVFGHWESDSIQGKGKHSQFNVIVERKSRYTYITRLEDLSGQATARAIKGRLKRLDSRSRRSITYDNGTENSRHEEVNKALASRSFFCRPYHSWEKGTVENTNGLIRWFWPKKSDLKEITEEDIREMENWLNHRPRKCLKFKTPHEVFMKLSGATPP